MKAFIPFDELAEAMAVAIAVATPEGGRLAQARLVPADLYRPDLARIVAGLDRLAGVDGWEERQRLASEIAGVPLADVERLVAGIVELSDTRGRWARRVRQAARRRSAMTLAAEIYNTAADATPEQLLDLARRILADLLELAADSATPSLAAVS